MADGPESEDIMAGWKTEQDFYDKEYTREYRECVFAIGCDYGRIELEKYYHYNGSGNKAFGGAKKWPVLALNIDFETGKEQERDELIEKLKKFLDKVKP